MRTVITILTLTTIALMINVKISKMVVAQREWEEDLKKIATPTDGYFGIGCKRVYEGEGEFVYRSLVYDLRRILANDYKNFATKQNKLR